MSPRSFYKLLTVSVLVFITAVAVWILTPEYSAGTFFGELLMPGLIDKINDVEVVSIEHEGETKTFLRDHDGSWSFMEENGYPADKDRIRKVLIGMSRLEKIEQKTALPEFYPDIQVEDNTAENAKSYLVTLLNAEGEKITSLLVGKNISGITWNGQGYFTRFPNDAQSWLVRGNMDVTGSRHSWVQSKILPLIKGRISTLVLTDASKKRQIIYRRSEPAAPLVIVYLSDTYFVTSPESVTAAEQALTSFTFKHALKRPDDLAKKEPFRSSLIKTGDGMNIFLFIFLIDSKPYAAVSFSAEKEAPESVIQEAADLEALHSKWLYLMEPEKIAPLNPFLTVQEEKESQPAEEPKKVEEKNKEQPKKAEPAKKSKPPKKKAVPAKAKKNNAADKPAANKTADKPTQESKPEKDSADKNKTDQ
ncbi:MAG: DUF4340 domain-containing protein [Alphaproteobacteria bacterium]|nr:DUF4340 domain-containing protein [Alphaproteobacteria bacterium]